MPFSNRYASPFFIWLGIGCLGVLLFFAWHFYLVRVAYLDLAFHTFTYTKTNQLFIQNNRFVAAITQIVPLLAIRAQLSIDVVMRLYSLAFIIYYSAVFFISAGPLRNERVALVVPLMFTLLVSNTFYWAQSELPQGLALLLLYYAVVSSQVPVRAPRWLLLIALVPAIIYCHPLLIISFIFLWGYDFLLRQRFRDWKYYVLLLIALLSYGVRMHSIAPGSYEAQRLNFPDNLKHYFPHYLTLPSNQQFIQQWAGGYWALPLVLAALTIFYIWYCKQPLRLLRLLWIWLFVIGYSQVINISYPDIGTGISYYFENLYLPLGLFIAVPLALELLPAVQSSHLAVAGLALLFVVRLGAIWQAHYTHSAYQHWLTNVLRYTKPFSSHKVVFDRANVLPYHSDLSWATAYETLLLSARSGPSATHTIFITPKTEQMGWELAQPALLLTELEELPYTQLNPHYFQLPAAPYHRLNTPPPTDDLALRQYIASMKTVTLQFAAPVRDFRAGQQQEVAVRITNPTAQLLHSGLHVPHPTLFAYRFLTEDDWPARTKDVVNPLELDITQPWTQSINVVAPTEPGRYELEIRLISKDFADWPTQVRTPVEVKP